MTVQWENYAQAADAGDKMQATKRDKLHRTTVPLDRKNT
jgi:hypothetical protein